MDAEVMNLRFLVYGRELNLYQKALAKSEFEKLESRLESQQDRIRELEGALDEAMKRFENGDDALSVLNEIVDAYSDYKEALRKTEKETDR